jgi:hypothetical protein
MDPASEKRSVSPDHSGKTLVRDEKDVDTAAEVAGSGDVSLTDEEAKRIR